MGCDKDVQAISVDESGMILVRHEEKLQTLIWTVLVT
jgi:hypothetical protein